MGLNGGVGKMGAHLQIPIFEKESKEKGKREDFEEAEKRAPSLLNLAPTTKRCRSKIELLIAARNLHRRDLNSLVFSSTLKGFK